MTVGELRKELEDFPDDLVVLDGPTGHEIVIVEEDSDAVLFWA